MQMDALFGTNVNMYLFAITLGLLFISVVMTVLYFRGRKGFNAAGTLKVAEGVLNGADTITEVLKTIMPSNPIINIADKIIDYAKIGVAKAEQLYTINKITGAERNTEAKQFIYDALMHAGIERNAAIDKIVDGTVEAAVLMLGHADKPPDDCEGRGAEVDA